MQLTKEPTNQPRKNQSNKTSTMEKAGTKEEP